MADPITAAVGAIATYVSGAFAATAAGTATLAQTATVIGVNLAASAAVNAAATALLQPNTGAEGSPLEWRADPTAGVPFALGRVAAAGRIVHRDEWGADNRYQSIWTVCSGCGPIQQIEGFYADDVAVSFGANGAASTGPYADKMWLQTTLGASSDTALAQTGLAKANPGYEGWGASKALPYRSACQLTLYQDSKFKSYPSGEPRTRLTLKGIKLYDPRLDSTVPGGSGSHRWGTPSTYAYSDNPALLALNWAMGLYEGSQLVGGIGAGSAGVHLPAFMEWANVCDANGWVASAYPSSLDDRHQVLLGLMQAGGARYARFAGKISCIVSAPKSSVVTLSVDDTAGPFEIATNADRLDKINTLVPTCRMESHNWEDVPQDEISVASYVTADGGVIDRDLSYPFVALHADGSNRDQIAELAAYAILDSREPFSGTVPLKPWAMQIEPGDVFTITEPGFLLDGVELKCLTRSFDPMTNIVRVSFISESAGKHDFALGRTNTPPVPATITVPDIYDVPPPAVDAWSASAGNGQQPSIVITGSADQDNAKAFIVEYRTAIDPATDAAWADDDAGWRVFGQYDIATEGVVLTGLEPETAYQVAVKYVSQFGVIGERRVLGTITTGGMTASDVGGLTRAQLEESLAFLASVNPALAGGLGIREQAGYINLFTDPLFALGVGEVRSPQGVVEIEEGAPRAVSVTANRSTGDALSLVLAPRFDLRAGARLAAACEVSASGSISDAALSAHFYDGSGDEIGPGVTIASGVADGERAAGFVESADIPATTAQVELRLAGVSDGTGEGRLAASELLAAYTAPQQSSVPAFVDPKDETVSRALDLLRVDVERAYQLAGLEYETSVSRALITVLQEVTANAARYQIATQYETQGGETLSLIELLAADGESRILLLSGLLAFANTVVDGDPLVAMEVRNGIVHFLTEARLAEGGAFTHYTGSTLRICLGAHPVSGDVGIFLYDASGAPLLEFNATDNLARLYPAMAVEGFGGAEASAFVSSYKMTVATPAETSLPLTDCRALSLQTVPTIPDIPGAAVTIDASYTWTGTADLYSWFYWKHTLYRCRVTDGAAIELRSEKEQHGVSVSLGNASGNSRDAYEPVPKRCGLTARDTLPSVGASGYDANGYYYIFVIEARSGPGGTSPAEAWNTDSNQREIRVLGALLTARAARPGVFKVS